MQSLKVQRLARHDVYTDTARVNEEYRLDKKGKIPEGRVCKVSVVGGNSKLLSLRGNLQSDAPTICLDEASRKALGVGPEQVVALDFRQVSWLGQFLWAWRASDPGYRIAARVGLLSVGLGFLGVALGVVGICIALGS